MTTVIDSDDEDCVIVEGPSERKSARRRPDPPGPLDSKPKRCQPDSPLLLDSGATTTVSQNRRTSKPSRMSVCPERLQAFRKAISLEPRYAPLLIRRRRPEIDGLPMKLAAFIQQMNSELIN